LKLVLLEEARKEHFLINRLKYQIQLLHQVEKAKDVYHLN
jgi:hypothetical protein